ncbi:hypothetical protein KCP78_20515 [Salmonella enterica subsp. enterica]|nr:hypothetical protein KCP78_20515 [Salmonella enterica subsp. enterica]
MWEHAYYLKFQNPPRIANQSEPGGEPTVRRQKTINGTRQAYPTTAFAILLLRCTNRTTRHWQNRDP